MLGTIFSRWLRIWKSSRAILRFSFSSRVFKAFLAKLFKFFLKVFKGFFFKGAQENNAWAILFCLGVVSFLDFCRKNRLTKRPCRGRIVGEIDFAPYFLCWDGNFFLLKGSPASTRPGDSQMFFDCPGVCYFSVQSKKVVHVTLSFTSRYIINPFFDLDACQPFSCWMSNIDLPPSPQVAAHLYGPSAVGSPHLPVHRPAGFPAHARERSRAFIFCDQLLLC